jgi:hypothetical protein
MHSNVSPLDLLTFAKVFKFLKQQLSPSFDYDEWTSNNRNKDFPRNPFRGNQKHSADFTFKDTDGKLGQYFASKVPGFAAGGTIGVMTYHLEVKTTLDGIDTLAMLSNNQISLAKKYSPRLVPHQKDIYVLVRVYDVGLRPPEPKLQFFIDPWDWICRNSLHIQGEQGIYVRPALTSATAESTGRLEHTTDPEPQSVPNAVHPGPVVFGTPLPALPPFSFRLPTNAGLPATEASIVRYQYQPSELPPGRSDSTEERFYSFEELRLAHYEMSNNPEPKTL